MYSYDFRCIKCRLERNFIVELFCSSLQFAADMCQSNNQHENYDTLSCWRQILLEFTSSGSTILLCSLCLTRSPTALLSVVVLFRLLLCSKISSFRTSPSMLSRINTNLHSLSKLPVNPRIFFEIENFELSFLIFLGGLKDSTL